MKVAATVLDVSVITGTYVGNSVQWLVRVILVVGKAYGVWCCACVGKLVVVCLEKDGEINSRFNTAVYAIYKSCKRQGIGPAR